MAIENIYVRSTVRADMLLLGKQEPLETITLTSGTGVYGRGQVVGMVYTTGKYKKYATGASDGTEYPCRVVVLPAGTTVDTTSGDVVVNAVKEGEVNLNKLLGLGTLVGDEAAQPGLPLVAAPVAGGTLAQPKTYQYAVIHMFDNVNITGSTVQGTAVATSATTSTNKSITIQVPVAYGVDSYKLIKSEDTGTTYVEYVLTAGEQAAISSTGYMTVVDDGSKTWATATYPTATDFKAIKRLEMVGIEPLVVKN